MKTGEPSFSMNDPEVRSSGSFSADCDTAEVAVEKCSENAVLPAYARQGDAGMDLCASEEVILAPGETKLVRTGLKVAIPEGYEIQVRPRSGLSLNTPLRIPNSPGTIDAGYRDEICVIVSNQSAAAPLVPTAGCTMPPYGDGQPYPITTKGNKPGSYIIRPGDRIAQIVLQKVPRIVWREVLSVGEIGVNRNGGFGSTGNRPRG